MSNPLSPLQLLLNGSSKTSIGEAFELVFEHRAVPLDDSSKAHVAQLFKTNPDETEALLHAIKVLIRGAMRKGISQEQLAAAFPDDVDPRLKTLLLKMLSRAVPIWKKQLEEQNGVHDVSQTPQKVPDATTPNSTATENEKTILQVPVQQPAMKNDEQTPTKPVHVPNTEHLPKIESTPEKVQEPKTAQTTEHKPIEQNTNQQQQTTPEKNRVKQYKSTPLNVETPKSTEDLMFPSLASFDWRIDIKSASDSVAQMSVPTVLVQMDVDTPKQRVDGENGRRVVTFEMTNEMLSTMLEGMRFVREQLANIK